MSFYSQLTHAEEELRAQKETKDAYGGNYPSAKKDALERSDHICQFCGLEKATHAHHWAYFEYPSGKEVTEDDLTALCEPCHDLATGLRSAIVRSMKRGKNSKKIYKQLTQTLYGPTFDAGSCLSLIFFVAVVYVILTYFKII